MKLLVMKNNHLFEFIYLFNSLMKNIRERNNTHIPFYRLYCEVKEVEMGQFSKKEKILNLFLPVWDTIVLK